MHYLWGGHIVRGQFWGSHQFSLWTMQILMIKLRSSGLGVICLSLLRHLTLARLSTFHYSLPPSFPPFLSFFFKAGKIERSCDFVSKKVDVGQCMWQKKANCSSPMQTFLHKLNCKEARFKTMSSWCQSLSVFLPAVRDELQSWWIAIRSLFVHSFFLYDGLFGTKNKF